MLLVFSYLICLASSHSHCSLLGISNSTSGRIVMSANFIQSGNSISSNSVIISCDASATIRWATDMFPITFFMVSLKALSLSALTSQQIFPPHTLRCPLFRIFSSPCRHQHYQPLIRLTPPLQPSVHPATSIARLYM